VCDAVEPARQRLLLAHGVGPAREHDERGLERVFRVVRVTQDVQAGAVDEAAVPPQQRGERVGVAGRGEAVEQLAVGQFRGAGGRQPAEAL
jgi:hypothetical protein